MKHNPVDWFYYSLMGHTPQFEKYCSNIMGYTVWWRSRRGCTHLLLWEHQNHNQLLNKNQQEYVGSYQKKDTPCPRQRWRPNKTVGEVKSHLESNLRPTSDARRAQTKPYALQNPRKGSVTDTRDWAKPAFESLSVSCGDTGQQWPTAGTGALAASALGGAACGVSPVGGGHH